MLLAVVITSFLGYANASCFLHIVNKTNVCTCNSTHCDTLPTLGTLSKQDLKVFITSRSVPGFTLQESNFGNLTSNKSTKFTLNINSKVKYQTIVGFGGAFTDWTGQNIQRLPEKAQEKLLASYFGKDGIEYNLCRVPIGGTDFSKRAYSLDDHDGDISLEYFELQEEDLCYKIPYIKEALKLTRGKLKLVATAWSAPAWMKHPEVWSGYSMLKNTSYQLWADYTVKFFDEFERVGIKFWGMTTGNEPMNGFYNFQSKPINGMGWIPELQAKWLSENLGPTLRRSAHKHIKIMIHDDVSTTLPFYVPPMFDDDEVLKNIDGIATHWYWDTQTPFEIRDLAKTDKKDVFFLSTEASFFKVAPYIGDWGRARDLAEAIIIYLAYGYVGWVDWNMVLDYHGGFTTLTEFLADAPILLSPDATEFYKQPIFYVHGHFSKFVVPGAVRLETSLTGDDLNAVAFLRPDNLKAVVILNKSNGTISLRINDSDRNPFVITIPGDSLQTVLYTE